MLTIVLLAMLAGGVISGIAVGIVRRVSLRAGALDSAPMPGQVKMATRRIPNTGGIGLVAGIVLPMIAGLVAAWVMPDLFPAAVQEHLPGVRAQTPLAVTLLLGMLGLHILGLIDDRAPLGPWLKLGIMTTIALGVIVGPAWITGNTYAGTRLLTALDGVAGGSWLSIAITVVWFLAVMNALNFIDNMDGACAGVSAIAGGCFLAAAALGEQWFVAGTLALLVGACVGFLVWNYPKAKIFMGDGGSLVIGFLLAFLTTRTTYLPAESTAGTVTGVHWYGVLMPLLVLAVPLYDMTTVTLIRLRQGKSPLVGDLQHLSHRLVKRGLSKRAAVAVMWGFTAALGLPAVGLARLPDWIAVLVGAQATILLVTIAVLEWSSSTERDATDRDTKDQHTKDRDTLRGEV